MGVTGAITPHKLLISLAIYSKSLQRVLHCIYFQAYSRTGTGDNKAVFAITSAWNNLTFFFFFSSGILVNTSTRATESNR